MTDWRRGTRAASLPGVRRASVAPIRRGDARGQTGRGAYVSVSADRCLQFWDDQRRSEPRGSGRSGSRPMRRHSARLASCRRGGGCTRAPALAASKGGRARAEGELVRRPANRVGEGQRATRLSLAFALVCRSRRTERPECGRVALATVPLRVEGHALPWGARRPPRSGLKPRRRSTQPAKRRPRVNALRRASRRSAGASEARRTVNRRVARCGSPSQSPASATTGSPARLRALRGGAEAGRLAHRAHGRTRRLRWRPRTRKPRRSGVFCKRLMGFEPTTFCMASRRSSQLSYSRRERAV